MIAKPTVVCASRDNAGRPTHEETVVADFGIDEVVRVVMMPTAQQRTVSRMRAASLLRSPTQTLSVARKSLRVRILPTRKGAEVDLESVEVT